MEVIILLLSSLLLTTPVYASELPTHDVPIDMEIIEYTGESVDTEQFDTEAKTQGNQTTINTLVGGFVNSTMAFTDSQRAYWEQFTDNYLYNQLNDRQRNIWLNLDEQCYKYLLSDEQCDSIAIGNIEAENFTELFTLTSMYKYAHPQFFFLTHRMGAWKNGDKYGVVIYIYDQFKDGQNRYEATNQVKNQLQQWCSTIPTNTTDYEKILNIHKVICDKVSYDRDVIKDTYDWTTDTHYSQSIYSLVNSDKTVCSGYTQAFSILATYFGLNNMAVTGGGHAWDLVEVNNNWYKMDLTWDDSSSSYVYFLFTDYKDDSHNSTFYYTPLAPKVFDGYDEYNGITYYMPYQPSWDTSYCYDVYYNLGDGNINDYSNNTLTTFGYKYWETKLGKITRIGYTLNSIKRDDKPVKKLKAYSVAGEKINLTVDWTPIKYNIVFNKSNSKAKGKTKAIKNIEYDQEVKLTKCGFKSNGYTFVGWAMSKNGEVVYKDCQEIKNLRKTTGTIYLYAIWEKDEKE